jgi:hypothetical protein
MKFIKKKHDQQRRKARRNMPLLTACPVTHQNLRNADLVALARVVPSTLNPYALQVCATY